MSNLEARIQALEAEVAKLKESGTSSQGIPPPGPIKQPAQNEPDDIGHKDAPVPLPARSDPEPQHPHNPPKKLEPNYDHEVTSFDQMGLKPELLGALKENGYSKPTALQSVGLVPIIRGRNVLLEAPSESGRIISYALSAIQSVDPSRVHVQVLIVAASKERAVRIAKAIRVLGGEETAPRSGTTPKVYACIAGTSTSTDIEALSRRPQIVVGTPGRIFHLLDRDHLSTSHLKALLLDEADDLLSTFKQLIVQIRKILPDNPLFQTVWAADSFPPGPLALALQYAHQPTIVKVREQDGVFRVVPAVHKREEEEDHP